jgi:hypothetical protein
LSWLNPAVLKTPGANGAIVRCMLFAIHYNYNEGI